MSDPLNTIAALKGELSFKETMYEQRERRVKDALKDLEDMISLYTAGSTHDDLEECLEKVWDALR